MPMLFARLSDAEMQQLGEVLAARGYPGGTKELAAEARGWIRDCQWADLDEDAIEELPDAQALSGIARKYDGGLDAFIASCGYPPGTRF